ncbi:hypothetical protein CUMW_139100 [Citrus unshiu]|uniref:AMP-dependent synthetase/ligase domain-containing protein n=1 Tax=Citrus unshiu TaxID=55188 RepID=A0A2H5PIY4_CITUN|nr:hypothetical protein CUMW_139100 [Citrus unshiu]
MEQLLLPNSANSTPLTTLGFLERAAAAYTDCPSLVYNNTTYTWSETHRRCLQVASSLSSVGIQRGHVVSVVAPNVPSMYELQFGVPMSGAILNNINTRLDAHNLSVLLQHSESKLVFVDHLHSSLVLEALSLFPRDTKRPHLVLIDDDAAASSTTTTSPTVTVDFIDTYEGFVEEGDPKYKWVQPRSEWDPMVLNYTSGTTSSPKGVVHSHRGIFILTANALIDWAVPKLPRGKTEGKARSEDVGLAEVDVVNPETGESVKRDGVSLGEVVLRGGCVTVGYFKDKEATRRCISDNGWFYTGDIGVMHADGYVEIKDRSKDVIISGGENICSAEVESVLYSITAVNEAAVVARPDMFWGEIPCAFVSLKRDLELTEKPTEKEIIEYCRARLPRYMVPRKVVFSEELPKTSTGKIQKYLLREFAKSVS